MSTINDAPVLTGLASRADAPAAKSGAEEIQNRFLALLVAQMKNQDPLNPLDNAQVTSQMAQLSTVQGIESMKASMQALAASLAANQMTQAAGLIGRAVLVPGERIGTAPENAVAGFSLAVPADNVKLVIENAAGATVRTIDAGSRSAGTHLIGWDGKADDGQPAPEGAYQFRLVATQGGRALAAESLTLATVTSISQNAQGVRLDLAGGGQAGYGDIRQIY